METTAKPGSAVIKTPIWILVARIFQIILSIIVVGASAWWIHGLYLNELGFAIVCGLFTWIISLYTILSEKVSTCQRGYNAWAVLSLEGIMIVFWLSAMGAVASIRGTFKYSVSASCTNDGSAINSGYCTIEKRVAGVATDGALAVMSGIAGICPIEMLLFVVSFAYVCHFFRRSFGPRGDAEKTNDLSTSVQYNLVSGGIEMPIMNSQQQQRPYAGEQPKWSGQHVQQAGYPLAAPAYDPYAQQNTAYAATGDVHFLNQIGQQNQPSYGQQQDGARPFQMPAYQ